MPVRNSPETALFFNFGHKGHTPRFKCRLGKDATPRRKIAHSGTQRDEFLEYLRLLIQTAYSLVCDANFEVSILPHFRNR